MTTLNYHKFAFCFLKDQEQLSAEGHERALQIREAIRRLIEGREAYIRRAGLDPEIHLPMANWALDEGLHAIFRTVLNGDYAILNNLRLFTQVFSGFQLGSLSGGDGIPLPDRVPADLDERLAAIVASGDSGLMADVARYQETIRHLPECLHVGPPRMLGEVGCLVGGTIVNHDTNAYLERVLLLAQCGKLWELRNRKADKAGCNSGAAGRPTIVEIGSGYGGLAYYLRKLVPECRYYLVDIPESLLMSSLYLSTLFPECDNVLITPDNLGDLEKDTPGFTFVPNFLFDECVAAGVQVDLAINTLSMSEMTQRQVRYYCQGIGRLLGEQGVFFEQNRDTRFRGLLDARRIIRDCFGWCLPLKCPFLSLQQGEPHLWAARPVPPYQWQESRDLKFRQRDVKRLVRESLRRLKRAGQQAIGTGQRA